MRRLCLVAFLAAAPLAAQVPAAPKPSVPVAKAPVPAIAKPQTVSEKMGDSLDTLGLPHQGSTQSPPSDDRDALVEGLKDAHGAGRPAPAPARPGPPKP